MTSKKVQVDRRSVPIGKVKTNPNNPRVIKDEQYKRLVKSLQDFPDMLRIRELVVDESMTVLGGNMRLRALQELGVKDVDVCVVRGLTTGQKAEFIVKDNAAFGEWDLGALMEGWGDMPLADWGVDVPEDWGVETGGEGKPDGAGECLGVKLPFGLHYRPRFIRRKGISTLTLATYAGEKEILDEIKEWKKTESEGLNTELAGRVCCLITEAGLQFDVVTTPARHHEGYHAATSVAKVIAATLKAEFIDFFGLGKLSSGHHPKAAARAGVPEIAAASIALEKRILVFDDVATSGGTIVESVRKLRGVTPTVTGVVLVYYYLAEL